MDSKSINFTSRQNLGFFIAPKVDSEEGRNEFDRFDKTCKYTTDLLRETKIRPSNLSANWEKLGVVINQVHDFAQSVGVPPENAHGYAASVIFASFARYSTLMERKKQQS